MNELDIKAPDGYEIDLENSDLSTGVIRFKEAKQGLVKSWWDLKTVSGYYVDDCGVLVKISNKFVVSDASMNSWATKEQAEASIAMAMLSQLMKQANGDWTPDWTDTYELKHTIHHWEEESAKGDRVVERRFLAFKSKKIRDEFLELHRDLIEKAKPLL